jgi:hypothetical protein
LHWFLGLLAILLTPRPDILIYDTGKLFAVRLPGGRLGLSKTSWNKFAASKWLQDDGKRKLIHWSQNFRVKPSVRCEGLGCLYENDRHKIAFVRHLSALSDDRISRRIFLTPKNLPKRIYTNDFLRDLSSNGAYAVYLMQMVSYWWLETTCGALAYAQCAPELSH